MVAFGPLPLMASALTLDAEFSRIKVGTAAKVFEEVEGPVDPDQVLIPNASLKPVEFKKVNMGFKKTPHWMHLVINSSSPEQRQIYLVAEYPILDLITLYQKQPNGC